MKKSLKKSLNIGILASAAAFMTGCGPDPVPMTEANVPKYTRRAECVAKYGEANCRHNEAGGYFHPHYVPGQTYWYPNRGSYYGGSPTSSYTPRSSTYSSSGVSSSGSGYKSSGSITSSRGGFGSTGSAAS